MRCGYCGIPWPRNQLVRDAAGLLRCPDDRRGLDVVTLSRFQAEARQPRPGLPPGDGATVFSDHGAYDGMTAEEYAETLK